MTKTFIGFTILAVIVGAYPAWYSYDRYTKIAHNVECDRLGKQGIDGAYVRPSCVYEIVPPTLWEKFTGHVPGARPTQPLSTGCDQSATTTDCSTLPIPSGESGYFFPASSYTEFASTSQSGKIDAHLTVDNSLIEVTACGKIYRTRQIFIDGADVVSRLATLANTGALPKDDMGHVGLCQSLPGEIHLRGIIETNVKAFEGSDVGLPGITYLVGVAANGFDVNPQTGNIYQASSYDGLLSGPVGTLWTTYTNDELGISFSYPSNTASDQNQWGIGRGETGASFHASIGLPSGAVIYAYATTKDYSAAKGGFSVATEGFVVKGGTYYAIRRGEMTGQSFVADEQLSLADGTSALIVYGKNYDPSADYPEPPVHALVNLRSQEFTGIGFVLFNKDIAAHPVSSEDIAILKKIVTSIRFAL